MDLNLCKLCYIADQSEEALEDQASLDLFDNMYGWIVLEERLLDILSEGYRGPEPIPIPAPSSFAPASAERVRFLVRTAYSALGPRCPALLRHVEKLLHDLAASRFLVTEDMIALMTLCGGPDFAAHALFTSALEYSTKTYELELGSHTNVWQQIVWRRAMLAGDWAEFWQRRQHHSDEQNATWLRNTILYQLVHLSLEMGKGAAGFGLFDGCKAMLLILLILLLHTHHQPRVTSCQAFPRHPRKLASQRSPRLTCASASAPA
jgi:hypothetical protein